MEFASSVIVIITTAYVFPQGIRDVVLKCCEIVTLKCNLFPLRLIKN